jgi:hypothetical protein
VCMYVCVHVCVSGWSCCFSGHYTYAVLIFLTTDGLWGPAPGLKRPGLKTDLSHPFCVDVKNAWSATFMTACFHGVVLN